MNKTKIEWCNYTWNPITGCSPASVGCKHCYAAAMARRFPQIHGITGTGVAWDPVEAEPIPFTRPVFHQNRLDEPLHLQEESALVFTGSMTDMFHPLVDPLWLDMILEVMAACRHLTFIILTKRPENIEEKFYGTTKHGCRKLGGVDYLPNLWLGVTTENQATADTRIPALLRIPAAVRIVSAEPLLEPIELPHIEDLDWVIAGPETGPGARPCRPEWIQHLADQCQYATTDIPFFDKSKNPIRRHYP